MVTHSPPKHKTKKKADSGGEREWSPPDICVGMIVKYLEPHNMNDLTKWCPGIVEHIDPGEEGIITVRALPRGRPWGQYTGIRHIEDPKLKEGFNHGRGRWDISDETKRNRVRLDALESQIDEVLSSLRPKPTSQH
jgi:hypothetical protein